MLNIKVIINFFFNLLKKKNRFSIATTKNFKNNYYANDNFNIKFSKIKKKDRDLIYKYLSLTDTKNGAHNFLNWGGLKKNKSKIDKYEIKSCDILLERKIL